FIMSLIVMGGGSAYGSEEMLSFTRGEMGIEVAISSDTKIVLISGGSGLCVMSACVMMRRGEEWEPRLWRHLYSYAGAEYNPYFCYYDKGVLVVCNRHRKEVCRKELPLDACTPQEQAMAKAWLGEHLVFYSSRDRLQEAAMREKGLQLLRESAEAGCPDGMRNLGSALIRRARETQNKQMEEEGEAWKSKAERAQAIHAEQMIRDVCSSGHRILPSEKEVRQSRTMVESMRG
ncbi:MAG: hypothetical protein J1E42_08950, partial [Akkermansiaceae bacterium]|nr:hypothetical protein [Akkermansiaceae bacterium]